MNKNLQSVIIKNTISSYILFFIKFCVGVVLTRILFLELGNLSYGFWVLLWSVFGYSLLLDFGFGTSIQKYTAEVTVTEDYEQFNQLISTVLFSYFIMALVIIVITLVLQFFLDSIFSFKDMTKIDYYRKVFLIFGIGAAFTFPTGAFSEILRGLKKIYIRNIIQIFSVLLNYIGIVLIFHFNYSLLELTVFSILLNFLINIIMGISCFIFLPQLKIRYRFFKLKMLKKVTSFSLYAYLIMFANMIIYKTDNILVGSMIGLSAVAIYQVGSRLSEVIIKLSTQFQENLTPIAASFYKAGNYEKLKLILIHSNKFIAFITFIIYITLTILSAPILHLWLKLDSNEALYICWIINSAVLFQILFKSCSNKVLLMTGTHKKLAKLSMAECFLNLVFSIIFIKLIGVVGVAVGTLIPCILINVFYIFPMASRFSKVSIGEYFTKIYLPLIVISIPSIIILVSFLILIPVNNWTVATLIYSSFSSGIVYLILSYLFYLSDDEKDKFRSIINKIIPGKRANYSRAGNE